MKDSTITKIIEFMKMAQYVATTLECRLVPPFSDDMKAIREQSAKLLEEIESEL